MDLIEKINLFVKLASMTHAEARSILEVSPHASEKEINNNYRKLMLKFHPDLNKEPGASTKAVLLNIARDTLINQNATLEQEPKENSIFIDVVNRYRSHLKKEPTPLVTI